MLEAAWESPCTPGAACPHWRCTLRSGRSRAMSGSRDVTRAAGVPGLCVGRHGLDGV